MIEDDPICVIGIGCRYPGEESSVEGFWDTIVNARSTQTKTPSDRFNSEAYYHPNHERAGAVTTTGGYFLRDGISRFDAPFFSITANEAASMDPQQRMLLEVAYETIESAGLTLNDLRGSHTGCYVGSFTNDYEASQRDIYDIHPYAATGTGRSILANRVSWFYDLKGPSFVVDTACSSSMYAFHLACQSIRLGESKMAFVGGVNAIIATSVLRTLSAMRFLSPTGKCHSYDQSADGYARGEGVGVLLLKRLSDAVADGDPIRAIVRASGVNQDGNTPGLTVPSASAQAALIRQCYEEAGIPMNETDYFEGHGTGTLLGDPIELQALGATFGLSRSMSQPLHVGSVKANIGHQEGGAGVAGLIRAILAMEKGVIPPTAELKKTNAAFRLDDWKIALPEKAKPWPSDGVRRISVNSFGYGGANSHVILEEGRRDLVERRATGGAGCTTLQELDTNSASEQSLGGSSLSKLREFETDSASEWEPVTPDSSQHSDDCFYRQNKFLFPFSGFDRAALGRRLPQFAKFLQSRYEECGSDDNRLSKFMSDLAFTLAERRTTFSHRIAVVAGSISELMSQLQAIQAPKTEKVSRKESVAFVFTGQGAQYCRMSKGLLSFEVFRKSLEQSHSILASHGCQWNLLDEILRDSDKSQIDLPHLSQPICTAVQIAQVDLLSSWGVHAAATVGHSSGEIAAAYAAHKISHADALCIAYYRGLFSGEVVLRENSKLGGMLAVGLAPEEAGHFLALHNANNPEMRVVVACINSPESVTLSGDLDAITAIESTLKDDGVFARQLNTRNMAYHSHHMEPVAQAYLASMKDIRPLSTQETNVDMFSSVTGKLVTSSAELDGSYWVKNMLRTVKFSEAVHTMLHHSSTGRKRRRITLNHSVMLELGPSSTLKGPVGQILRSLNPTLAGTSSYVSLLKRGEDDESSALTAMARLWARGTPVDFSAINRNLNEDNLPRVIPDLPAYPWNDSGRIWHETTMNQQATNHPRTDLLGYQSSWRNMNAPVWRNMIRISETPWLADHRIHTTVLYAGSSMIVMALEAAQRLVKPGHAVQGYQFRDISFLKALVIPQDGKKVEVQLHVWANREGTRAQTFSGYEFSLVSLDGKDQWIEHCHGYFQILYKSSLTEVDGGLQAGASWAEKKATYNHLHERLHHHIPKEAFYSTLRRAAMMYGPTFQAVEEVYAGKGETHGTIVVPDTASVMPHNFEHSHLIHPTTLDAMTQFTFGTMLHPESGTNPGAHVPISIGKLYIAADLPSGPNAKFLGYATSRLKHTKETSCEIVVSDKEWSEPKLIFEDFLAMSVAQGVTGFESGAVTRRKCAQLKWVHDIRYLMSGENGSDSSRKTAISPQQVCPEVMAAINKSINVLRSTPHLPEHLQSLVEWAQREGSQLSAFGDVQNLNEVETESDVLAQFPKQLETLLVRGDNVASAITKELLDAVMSKANPGETSADFAAIDDWLDKARLYNPGLSILLLGDGSPHSAACYTARRHLISPRKPDGFQKCVFAEADTNLLQISQKILESEDVRPHYVAFNPVADHKVDGMSEGLFDAIVAPPSIACNEVALRRMRTLLSPRGTLILSGQERASVAAAFVLGLSEAWWSCRVDFLNGHSPLPTDNAHWDTILRQQGLERRGWFDAHAVNTTLFAVHQHGTDEELAKTLADRRVILILPNQPGTKDAVRLQSLLEKRLTSVGCTVTSSRLDDYVPSQGLLAICLAELSGAIIASMSETTFNSLKRLVDSTSALVWLTRGAVQCVNATDGEKGLSQSLATGLFRSIRSEFTRSRHVHVDISQKTDLTSQHTIELLIDALVREAIPTAPDATSEESAHERELLLDGQNLLVPRVIWDESFNKELIASHKRAAATQEALYQSDRALKLVIGSPGHLDSLSWVDDDARPLDRVLLPGECLIQVKAWPLNFMDAMAAMGQIPTRSLGLEFAGEVIRCGPGCIRTRPGMRVVIPRKPAFATYIALHERRCEEIPIEMDMATAATFPLIFQTAYVALLTQGRLQKGETVLIHAAAGGVGQACIQMAQWLGAEIYATVGSNDKRQLLIDRYGIQAQRIFSSRDLTFANGIMRETKGRGVDVVINSLSGEALRATWNCIASFGRFIELGKRDILNNAGLEMGPFLRQATFSSVNIETFEEIDQDAYMETWREVWELMRQGTIRPVFPITQFHVTDVEKAIRFVASGAHAGKVVIVPEIHPSDPSNQNAHRPQLSKTSQSNQEVASEGPCVVSVLPRKPKRVTLDPSGSYVLCGGFGGIGRAIARFLAAHGAKHLILLSRSGATQRAHYSLLKDLEEREVRVTVYKCDISDAAAISTFVRSCEESSWSVRGIVQCAMVLRDRMFENMTHEDWTEATKAKTLGTKNLSDALPSDMDFFIMLSSTSGIVGNKGQANYGAANTYMDAIATYRRAKGMNATSIDLGVVSEAGFLAENPEQLEAYSQLQHLHITQEELLLLLSAAIRGHTADGSPVPAQVIAGFGKDLLTVAGCEKEGKFLQAMSAPKSLVDGAVNSDAFRKAVAASPTLRDAAHEIEEELVARLGRALGIEQDDIDVSRPLHAYGVDSLVAVDLRNWLARELAADITIADILAPMSTQMLSLKIASVSGLIPPEVVAEQIAEVNKELEAWSSSSASA